MKEKDMNFKMKKIILSTSSSWKTKEKERRKKVDGYIYIFLSYFVISLNPLCDLTLFLYTDLIKKREQLEILKLSKTHKNKRSMSTNHNIDDEEDEDNMPTNLHFEVLAKEQQHVKDDELQNRAILRKKKRQSLIEMEHAWIPRHKDSEDEKDDNDNKVQTFKDKKARKLRRLFQDFFLKEQHVFNPQSRAQEYMDNILLEFGKQYQTVDEILDHILDSLSDKQLKYKLKVKSPQDLIKIKKICLEKRVKLGKRKFQMFINYTLFPFFFLLPYLFCLFYTLITLTPSSQM